MSVVMDDKVVQEKTEKISGKLSGVLEVVETNARKKTTKFKFVVDKMTLQKDDEAESTPLAAGTEILVQRGKDGKIGGLVMGKEVDEDIVKLLDLFFELPKDKEPAIHTDEAFGTDQPHKPGSEWALDIAKVIKSMPEDMPFEVDVDGSSGKMAFPEVKTVDGTECSSVQAKMLLKVKAMKDMAPGMKITKAAVDLSMKGLLPTDPALPDFGGTMKMDFNFVGTMATPDGNSAVFKVKAAREKTGDIRPLK